MARGYFRTSDKVCLYCGYTNDNKPMPHKVGKGANKTYLCESCFNKNYKKDGVK